MTTLSTSHLYKNLSVWATEEGIFLRSHDDTLKFQYGNGAITRLVDNAMHQHEIAVPGLLGILDLISIKYLVLVGSYVHVASVHCKEIYKLYGVTVVPLNCYTAAIQVIRAEEKKQARAGKALDEKLDIDDESAATTEDDSDHIEDEEHQHISDHGASSPGTDASSLATAAATPIANTSQSVKRYSAFAQRWIAGSGTTRRSSSMVTQTEMGTASIKPPHETAQIAEQSDSEDHISRGGVQPAAVSFYDTTLRNNTIDTYANRIVRNTKLLFKQGGFYFSHDHNLSLRLTSMAQEDAEKPFHERFEQDYLWNRHLLDPLVEAGYHQFVLPIMQGFVGERAFDIKTGQELDKYNEDNLEGKYLLTLISRRSIKRAGLRYLRRGIDDDGNVANYVETEQILARATTQPNDKRFSLVQIRGSIPLYFSQSPYSFKPLPQMHGSAAANHEAFRKHLQAVSEHYGSVQIASLVDKHATEASIGQAYEQTVQWLNSCDNTAPKIGFEWFDFHSVCKGMHFEKVSILISALETWLKQSGWTIQQDGRFLQTQSGVLRTNCMDCLDRTNVTQSAVGSWALQQQLEVLGLKIDLRRDPKTIWFNQLWADNGDAISRQYAGTAALKGDFTRTRKRNLTGALSDFTLTLNRYYNNIFGDYFLQTCIDYALGNIGPSAFDDYETNMALQDHAFDVRRVRQNAIDVCIKRVLEDPTDRLLQGWALSCPRQANTLRTLPLEECVLLLTAAALYFCRFDWSSEKVGSYERINLADITEIWRGPYITSVLGSAESDESKNVGFAVRYDTKGTAIVRSNTRTMQTAKTAADQNAGKNELDKQAEPERSQRRFLAFKMLHASAFVSKTGDHDKDEAENETARKISDAIAGAMATAMQKNRDDDQLGADNVPKVEEKPLIALADAKKSTGYLESVGYSLKKLVW